MRTTTKTTITKASPSKKPAAASKGHHATHPSWVDMIKECITAHPEDARGGVSRPTIKKFVETKHHVAMNATAASQLNRAIAHGAEKGIFVLPKGPSGKVKLAAQHSDAAKENAKPAAKKLPTSRSKPGTAKKPTTVKKSTTVKKPLKAKTTSIATTATKPKTAKATSTKSTPAAKKYTSSAKKAKSTTTKAKPVAAKKHAPAKKASTAKKGSC